MSDLYAQDILPKLSALVQQIGEKMSNQLQEQTRFGACDAFASALQMFLKHHKIECHLVRIERTTYELPEPFEDWQQGYRDWQSLTEHQRTQYLIDMNNLSHVVVGVPLLNDMGESQWHYIDAKSTQALDQWWEQWNDERDCISIFEPIVTNLLEIKSIRKAKNEPFDGHIKRQCLDILYTCELNSPKTAAIGRIS